MQNISTYLEETGELHNLVKEIDSVLKTNPKAITILAATDNQFLKTSLDPILSKIKIPISGGIFPKIIYHDKLLSKGSIIVAWYNDVLITNYKNIENTETIKDLIGTSNKIDKINDAGEYLIFIDSFSTQTEDNLDVLYKKIGFQASFAGAGAGSLTHESTHCIISNDGLLKNAMQTICTGHTSKITTTHGLQKQSGPHLVTSSDKTNVSSLNYEPIIDFYKKHNTIFRNHNQKGIDFSSFYTEYSIGIENIDGEILVRSPYMYDENTIKYIGNIPEYSKVHIMTNADDASRDLIDSELVEENLQNEKPDTTFIFSCAYRDDQDSYGYSKEIRMLNKHLKGSRHVVGTLSLGEIATSKSRLLQLHNNSIVISRLSGVL